MTTARLHGGPLDGGEHLFDPDARMYWCVGSDEGPRLVANTGALSVEDVQDALGVYTLHRSVVGRRASDVLVWRGWGWLTTKPSN